MKFNVFQVLILHCSLNSLILLRIIFNPPIALHTHQWPSNRETITSSSGPPSKIKVFVTIIIIDPAPKYTFIHSFKISTNFVIDWKPARLG